MKTYTIAAIPGDGIGQEVVSSGVEVLAAVAQRDGASAHDPATEGEWAIRKAIGQRVWRVLSF